MLDDASAGAGAQPQQRCDLLKRHTKLNGIGVLVGEVEEDRVLLEPVGHGELVRKFIVALDGVTRGRLARDGRRETRLGYVLANALSFPLGIALAQTSFN